MPNAFDDTAISGLFDEVEKERAQPQVQPPADEISGLFDEVEKERAQPQAVQPVDDVSGLFDEVEKEKSEVSAIERGEGLRTELTKRMQDAKFFPSFTQAATSAQDKTIKRGPDGAWDLPWMKAAHSGGNFGAQTLGGIGNLISGGAGALVAPVTGARLEADDHGPAKDVRDVFNAFQRDNNLSDEEVQKVFGDLVNRNRKWDEKENVRVQSDGYLELNPMGSGVLDTDTITKQINESAASDTAKQSTLQNLPRIQRDLAERKAKAYATASLASGRTDFTDYATARPSEDLPTLIKNYERDVVSKEGWGDAAASLITNDLLVQGGGNLLNTILGTAGALGSDAAAKEAAGLSGAMSLAKQGSIDTGLVGDIMGQVPSLAAQILLTRGAGAGATALGAGAKTAQGLATATAYGTAGLQSAGMTMADAYNTNLEKGMPEQEALADARAKAARAGVNTALITAAFGAGGFGGAEKVAVGKKVEEMTLRDLAAMAGEKGLGVVLKSPQFRTALGGIAKSFAGEGAEEGIDELGQAFLNQDPDTNLNDALDNAMRAGLTGAVMGGGVDLASSAITRSTAIDLASKAAPNAPAAAQAVMDIAAETPDGTLQTNVLDSATGLQLDPQAQASLAAAEAPPVQELAEDGSPLTPTTQDDNQQPAENPPLDMPLPPVPTDEQGAAPASGLPPVDQQPTSQAGPTAPSLAPKSAAAVQQLAEPAPNLGETRSNLGAEPQAAVTEGEKAQRMSTSAATSGMATPAVRQLASFANEHAGKSVEEVKAQLVSSGLAEGIATNDLHYLAKSISENGGVVADQAQKNADLEESREAERKASEKSPEQVRAERVQELTDEITDIENTPEATTRKGKDLMGEAVDLPLSEKELQRRRDSKAAYLQKLKAELTGLTAEAAPSEPFNGAETPDVGETNFVNTGDVQPAPAQKTEEQFNNEIAQQLDGKWDTLTPHGKSSNLANFAAKLVETKYAPESDDGGRGTQEPRSIRLGGGRIPVTVNLRGGTESEARVDPETVTESSETVTNAPSPAETVTPKPVAGEITAQSVKAAAPHLTDEQAEVSAKLATLWASDLPAELEVEGGISQPSGETLGQESQPTNENGTYSGGLFQQTKGSITFASDAAKAAIKLSSTSDASTLPHEMAHFLRRFVLDTSNPDAMAAAERRGITQEDVAAVNKWAGVKDGKWTKTAEEKFARAWERYLRDFRAPTAALQPIFDKMAAWLRDVYKTVKGSAIDIDIPTDIQAVFDKLAQGPQGAPAPQITAENVNDPATYEEILNPSPVEPNFDAPADPESPYRQRIEDLDKEDQRLGRPTLNRYVRETDQDSHDRALAAEDAHRAAGKPGTAGSALLNTLLGNPARTLTSDERSLVLMEGLNRKNRVDNAAKHLTELPADATQETRMAAQKEYTDAQMEYDLLREYVKTSNSMSGRSLQSIKRAIFDDYSLASIVYELKAAKNTHSEKPVEWTAKDQAKAEEISKKLLETQAALEALTTENRGLQDGLEKLHAEVEKLKAAHGKSEDETIKRRVKENLKPRADAARERLKAKGYVNKQSDTLNQVDDSALASDINDFAVVAAEWITDEQLSQQEVTDRLTAEFGEDVAPYAERIFNEATQVAFAAQEAARNRTAPTASEIVQGLSPETPITQQDVRALARAHIVAGKRGSAVMDAVLDDVNQVFPEATREELATLFTGYGTVTEPSTKEVPRELNRIRSLERAGLKLLDVLKGQLPKRTGLQRQETDAEVRAKEKEFRKEFRALEDKMREAGIELPSDAQRLKTSLDASKRRLTNEIEEIKRALATGEARTSDGKTAIQPDEESLRLRSKLEQLRELYNAAFPKDSKQTDEQRAEAVLKGLDRMIAEEQRMLAEGILKRPAATPVTSPKIEAKRQQLAAMRQMRRDIFEAQNPGATALEQAKAATRRAIEQLTAAVASGDVQTRRGQKVSPDAELQALLDAREALTDEVAELRKAQVDSYGADTIAIKRATEAAEKTLNKLNEKLAKGDLTVNPRKETAVSRDPGVKALKARIAELNKALNAGRRALKPTKAKKTEAEKVEAKILQGLEASKKALASLEARLAAKNLAPVPRTPSPGSRDPRVQAVRARIKELNRELASQRRAAKQANLSPEEAKLRRYLGGLKKRTDELNRRVRDKDFSTKAKIPLPNTPAAMEATFEHAKAQNAFNEAKAEHIYQNAPTGKKLASKLNSGSNLIKTITLGGDFGVLNRQLGEATTVSAVNDLSNMVKGLMPGRKGAGARATPSQLKTALVEAFRAFKSPTHDYAVFEKLANRPGAALDRMGGIKLIDPLESHKIPKEDIPSTNALEKIPRWVWTAVAGAKIGAAMSNPVLASAMGMSPGKMLATLAMSLGQKDLMMALDRAQRTATNVMRAAHYDQLVASMPGGVVNAEQAKALGKAVMVATGRGATDNQKINAALGAANVIALAPRWYLSRIQQLANYAKLPGQAVKIARGKASPAEKTFAAYNAKHLAGRAAMHSLLLMMFGKADDDDPTSKGLVVNPFSKDFGSVRINENVKFDIMGGLNQWAGAIARTVGRKELKDGRMKAYTPAEASQQVLNFLSSKRNMALGFAYDTAIKQEYFGGKPVTFATGLDEASSAIILDDLFKIAQYAESKTQAAALMGMLFTGNNVKAGDFAKEKQDWAELKAEVEYERMQRELELNQ